MLSEAYDGNENALVEIQRQSGASLNSCVEASRSITFTVDDPSCPPLPSPLSSVIDAAGGKADGISSESEPASPKDVIGGDGGTAFASDSAPMAPVKVGITLAHDVCTPRSPNACVFSLAHRRAGPRTTTSS